MFENQGNSLRQDIAYENRVPIKYWGSHTEGVLDSREFCDDEGDER